MGAGMPLTVVTDLSDIGSVSKDDAQLATGEFDLVNFIGMESNPEIRDHRLLIFVDNDVARLEIPMNQTVFVGYFQSLRNLPHPIGDLNCCWFATVGNILEAASLHELADDEYTFFEPSHVIHSDDMWMMQATVSLEAPPCRDVELVYLDVPYWIQEYGQYSNCADDIGNQSLAESTANLDRIA